jgi:DNA helicase HerA-like ATPase
MYDQQKRAWIALGAKEEICLLPAMANRHGLITGATGSGKTVTLQTLAETFSQMGVPVLAADIKGDLSGIAAPGGQQERVRQRVGQWRLEERGFAFQGFPVQFWDVFTRQGLPLRAPLASLGALTLSRLLQLNETQSGLLAVLFKLAQDEQLELIDIKDLSKLLQYAAASRSLLTPRYGHIPGSSLGAIQRGLIALEQEGAGQFFAQPGLDLHDLLGCREGKGVVNILAADKLMDAPRLYTSVLLWLLSQLFTGLPEVGDSPKPKLAFFFDEAHLLFSDISKPLLEKITQVIRLVRSKGVGVYFITQSPGDIPDPILSQLGNRIQHALRPYTPKDQQNLRAAARSFRPNPAFDSEKAIAGLSTGQALISFLDAQGAPAMVEQAFILPPQSRIGPLDENERQDIINASPLKAAYREICKKPSAHERLEEKMKENSPAGQERARDKGRSRTGSQNNGAASRRFWSGVIRSILLPLLRRLLRSLFKK